MSSAPIQVPTLSGEPPGLAYWSARLRSSEREAQVSQGVKRAVGGELDGWGGSSHDDPPIFVVRGFTAGANHTEDELAFANMHPGFGVLHKNSTAST